MTDSSQGGTPPHNPYGGQGSAGENPYGRPPSGEQPATEPSGQPPAGNPYGQPPTGSPYGQPPAGNPYGQPPAQPQPYASPYGQQAYAGPLGDGLDMYGRPLGTDERPGTVTAAGWITLILSGLTGLIFAFITLAMLVAKDQIIIEMNKAFAEQEGYGDINAEDAYGVLLVVMVAFTAWCVIACVLAVFAMRRSNVARILLVISSVVAGLLCVPGLGQLVSGIWLVACIAVVVMLFAGGASSWFAGRRRY